MFQQNNLGELRFSTNKEELFDTGSDRNLDKSHTKDNYKKVNMASKHSVKKPQYSQMKRDFCNNKKFCQEKAKKGLLKIYSKAEDQERENSLYSPRQVLAREKADFPNIVFILWSKEILPRSHWHKGRKIYISARSQLWLHHYISQINSIFVLIRKWR